MTKKIAALLTATLIILSSTSALAAPKQGHWRALMPSQYPTEFSEEVAIKALHASDPTLAQDTPARLKARITHRSKSGLKLADARQSIDGIEVFGRRGLVVTDSSGRPVMARHNFKNIEPNKLKRQPGFILAKGRKFWVEDKGVLVPATLSYRGAGQGEDYEMMAVLRSWPEGALIREASITDRLEVNYRVYDQDDPYGHSQPHPSGMPDGYLPAVEVPQVTLSIDERSMLRDDPWLPDGATETVGNNVDAFFNSIRNEDGSCDIRFGGEDGSWTLEFGDLDFRAQLNPTGFDYPYVESMSEFDFRHSSTSCEPPDPTDTQLNAKIVQNFYWGNLMHDWFYDAGLDEASGNAQHDNFGRGGLEGDRMIIHAGAPTTFVITPGDGESPVMVIGSNGFSAKRRDGSLDFSLFAHEFGHYVVRRLVGGGAAFLSTVQARSLNEGWADFIGVLVNTRASDFSGAAPGNTSSYAVGSYFNRDYIPYFTVATTTGEPDAQFYGIRRWPLGPSNPLTFRHMAHEEPLPEGYEFFDWKTRSMHNTEIHTAGEVWSAALWDCARTVFSRDDRSFEDNWFQMAEYMVLGMKLTPIEPTIMEARDAILMAMDAMDQQDHQACRSAFAARGMGSGALSAPRESRAMTDLVESFDNEDFDVTIVASALADDISSRDNDGILDAGETGTLTATIRNTGFRRIQALTIAPEIAADYQIKHPVTLVDLMPGAEETVTFQVELLHDRHYDLTEIGLNWRAVGRGARLEGSDAVTHRTHFNIEAWGGVHDAESEETTGDWVWVDVRPFPSRFIDSTWDRVNVGDNYVYRAGEIYTFANQALTSKPLSVSADEAFRIVFDQAYLFTGTFNGQPVTKGIAYVEISDDGGASWQQAGTFQGESAGFPSLVATELDLGMAYASQQVQVRFRLETDTVTRLVIDPTVPGGFGFPAVPVNEAWMIDNMTFEGITNQPFTTIVEQDAE